MSDETEYMTLDEYLIKKVNQYPILFISPSLDDAKLRLCDQIFNVIGSGLDEKRDFIKEIKKSKDFRPQEIPEKYINNEPIFSAYKEKKSYGIGRSGEEIVSPVFESKYDGFFSKSEIDELMKNGTITFFMEDEKEHKKSFYPNFQKEYSIVWKVNFSEIGLHSYAEGAKWFYEKAKEFFLSDESNNFHYAFPKDKEKREIRVKEMSNWLKKYDNIENQEERFKKISEAYETEFDGDIEKFQEKRWEKEKNRILAFLDETLEKLNSELSNNTKVKFKM